MVRKVRYIFIVFQNVLCKETCEEVYKIVNDSRSIGVSLLTNRVDLFVKYEENYVRVAKLQDKAFKQKAKYDKAKRKLLEAMEEFK